MAGRLKVTSCFTEQQNPLEVCITYTPCGKASSMMFAIVQKMRAGGYLAFYPKLPLYVQNVHIKIPVPS